MNERDETRLEWIKEESEYLLERAEGYDVEDFIDDRDLQHIVTMALINIGESVKTLSKDLKERYPEIKWRDIGALRDIAVHKYEKLRMEDIWENATVDVPVLLKQVKEILRNEGVEG